MEYFINKSIKYGANKIDWGRTIYFSLFGSSSLTFAMKWNSFDCLAGILFFVGVCLFLNGLIFAMRISDAFKLYEKTYPTLSADSLNKYSNKIDNYIFDEEKKGKKSIQHFILYTFFWFAIIIIGYSGYLTETKAKNNSTSQNKIIEQIEKHIDENKFKKNLIDSLLLNNEKLNYDIKTKSKTVDSLKNIIHKLKRK